MSNPKYKIRVVQTGIGDPFLLGWFQFETGTGISNPATAPLPSLQIDVQFRLAGGEWHDYGTVSLLKPIANWQGANEDATPRYFFGLPFDPGSNFKLGDSVELYLQFSAGSGIDILLDDGSNNHSTYQLSYTDSPIDLPIVSVYYSYPAVN